MKAPNVYARAAKRMEEAQHIYPCFAILEVREQPYTLFSTDPECVNFLAAFSGREGGMSMGAEFLVALTTFDERILALCFAAAMLDAGDL